MKLRNYNLVMKEIGEKHVYSHNQAKSLLTVNFFEHAIHNFQIIMVHEPNTFILLILIKRYCNKTRDTMLIMNPEIMILKSCTNLPVSKIYTTILC